MVEWISFVVVATVVLLVGAAMGNTKAFRTIRNLVLAAAVLRIFGMFARHYMIFGLYGGISDAVGYFGAGERYADRLWDLDLSVFHADEWANGKIWGTQALRYVSGIVVMFTGPSVRGAFLAFSFMSFLGLSCFVLAYRRATPDGQLRRYALFLFFWPSLWFWPSSIGKEAVLLLACGMATLGYVGKRGKIGWVTFLAGLALAFLIRPHVAGVLIIAVSIAEWIGSSERRWTSMRIAQALVTGGLAVWLFTLALGKLGVASTDLEGVQEFIEYRSSLTARGGSQIGGSSGLATIPMAFVNVLFRPALFEAHNLFAAVSALEMTVFWVFILRYRRGLMRSLKRWRENRLLRFAGPYAVMYIFMIGVTFHNMGIIARQRVLVLPMLLILLAGTGGIVKRKRTAVAPEPEDTPTPDDPPDSDAEGSEACP